MDQARWCAAASSPRPSEFRIKPGRHCQGLLQITRFRLVCADPAHDEIAIAVDPPADVLFARKPAQELARDAIESFNLPAVDGPQEMARETFRHLNGTGLAKPLLIQRGG